MLRLNLRFYATLNLGGILMERGLIVCWVLVWNILLRSRNLLRLGMLNLSNGKISGCLDLIVLLNQNHCELLGFV